MHTTQEIILHDATDDMLDGFGVDPNPDAYEEHELIDDSIRGPKGAVVRIHKNDLAVLRRNGLIATPKDEAAEPVDQVPELTKAEKAAQAKAEKAAKAAQPKAEAVEPVAQADADAAELAKALELAASIADQPAAGV